MLDLSITKINNVTHVVRIPQIASQISTRFIPTIKINTIIESTNFNSFFIEIESCFEMLGIFDLFV